MLSRFFEEAKSVAGCSHKMAGRDAWEGRMKVIGRVNKSKKAKNCLFVVFFMYRFAQVDTVLILNNINDW